MLADRLVEEAGGRPLVPRRAGGASKYRAIRAALRGAWVNVLVTDLDTAHALAEEDETPSA